jgi:uncharacterized membrane-anchored protein YitT (DUF2179 family)
MGTVVQFLIKNTGLYNAGLNAIVQGIARITNTLMLSNDSTKDIAPVVFNILFWGLYIVANVPLFIFAHRKIGKTFANLTMVFVIVNSL